MALRSSYIESSHIISFRPTIVLVQNGNRSTSLSHVWRFSDSLYDLGRGLRNLSACKFLRSCPQCVEGESLAYAALFGERFIAVKQPLLGAKARCRSKRSHIDILSCSTDKFIILSEISELSECTITFVKGFHLRQ
jgi:hypothetical protein